MIKYKPNMVRLSARMASDCCCSALRFSMFTAVMLLRSFTSVSWTMYFIVCSTSPKVLFHVVSVWPSFLWRSPLIAVMLIRNLSSVFWIRVFTFCRSITSLRVLFKAHWVCHLMKQRRRYVVHKRQTVLHIVGRILHYLLQSIVVWYFGLV